MRHTTEELLLAAHVRALALDLRNLACAEAHPEGYSATEKNTWLAAHPFSDFITAAVRALDEVVDLIKPKTTA